jgi:hypothetical protein
VDAKCAFRSAVTVGSKGLNTSQKRERRTPGSFKGETGGVDRERVGKIPKVSQLLWVRLTSARAGQMRTVPDWRSRILEAPNG